MSLACCWPCAVGPSQTATTRTDLPPTGLVYQKECQLCTAHRAACRLGHGARGVVGESGRFAAGFAASRRQQGSRSGSAQQPIGMAQRAVQLGGAPRQRVRPHATERGQAAQARNRIAFTCLCCGNMLAAPASSREARVPRLPGKPCLRAPACQQIPRTQLSVGTNGC